ncbi:MAG TPA: cupin domain-containing protein [Dissulfurispiraceae bacterium]|nr:cupin domain-containing protein [Dissulfurispiraceae bacterium]
MSRVFDVNSTAWQPVRPDVAESVFGRTLLDGNVKTVLTRVAPGGKFKLHKDNYAHLFYFLSGEGVLKIGEERFDITPGLTASVNAGDLHGYENTGDSDLMLLSLNLPA